MSSAAATNPLQIQNLLFKNAYYQETVDRFAIASEWLVTFLDTGVTKVYHITIIKTGLDTTPFESEFKINVDDCSLNLGNARRLMPVTPRDLKRKASDCFYRTTADFTSFNIGKVLIRNEPRESDIPASSSSTKSKRATLPKVLQTPIANRQRKALFEEKERSKKSIRALDISDAKIAELFQETLKKHLIKFIAKQLKATPNERDLLLPTSTKPEPEKRQNSFFCCFC